MAQLIPDDVVIALLHFLPEEGAEPTFTADREAIHNTLNSLRKTYPEFLGSLRFRKRYLFPESRTLDQALSNLEASGLLQRKNEEPRIYFVIKEIHDAYNHFVKKRLKDSKIDESRVQELAKSFSKSLSET